jgi:hypothetical protein
MKRLALVLEPGNLRVIFFEPGIDVTKLPFIRAQPGVQFLEGVVVGGKVPGDDFVAFTGSFDFSVLAVMSWESWSRRRIPSAENPSGGEAYRCSCPGWRWPR